MLYSLKPKIVSCLVAGAASYWLALSFPSVTMAEGTQALPVVPSPSASPAGSAATAVSTPSPSQAKTPPVPEVPLPAGCSPLTTYINNMAPPGWQAHPFYIWTRVAAPAIVAGQNNEMASQAVSAPGQASTNVPPVQSVVRSAKPQLPDGDNARETILNEYCLNGFFRKSFNRGQRFIYIDIYDFQNSDGAFGAYTYLRRGSTTVLPRGDAASEDDASISVVQGKTFISIYGTSQDDDESKELLTKVVGQAVKYMGERGALPAVLNRLPQLDLVHGSEKIVMGPVSARRFFPAPYLNSLGMENNRVVGCVGDYQLQEPVKERLKLLVLSFKSPSEAALSYQRFLTELGADRDESAAELLSQPINVLKTGRTYLGVQQKNSDILMVTGARKRFSPAMILHQVR